MVNHSVVKSALALVVLIACLGLMGDARASSTSWEQIVRRYSRNSVREKDSFLALSDILTNNFTLSELEKDMDEDGEADVDIEMIREVCSSNADLPIAARVLSRIQAAKPTQVNKIININDSVISRSNLNFEGEENIEDSVINRNNKV